MDGTAIYQGLLDRGYTEPQAAALAGNIVQESGGNPAALNAGEGAHGLLQWRNDRFDALNAFAKANGSNPADPNTQLDFIRSEMGGAEKRSAAPFLSAPDVESANTALKGYIRYGDNSQGTRLANAQGFLKGGAAPMSMAGPQPPAQAAPAAPAPQQPAAAPMGYAPAAAPSAPQFNMAALAATPQLQNTLRTPNPYGLKIAPFSLGG